MWFIASSLFTFQVCTTRFNNKNKFFGYFVCLVGRASGAGAVSPLLGQEVELEACPCYCSATLCCDSSSHPGDVGKQAKLNCLASGLFLLRPRFSSIDSRLLADGDR